MPGPRLSRFDPDYGEKRRLKDRVDLAVEFSLAGTAASDCIFDGQSLRDDHDESLDKLHACPGKKSWRCRAT